MIPGFESKGLSPAEVKAKDDAFKKEITAAVNAAGYPAKAKPIPFMSGTWWKVVADPDRAW